MWSRQPAFAVKSLKKCGKTEQELSKRAQQLMFETAQAIIKSDIGNIIFENYRRRLQEKSKREIKVEVDNSLETAASFELAENYKRSYHLIKYNQKYPAVYHLMMHELVHLEYMLDAREAKCNKLFVSNQINNKVFINDLQQHRQKLIKLGLPEESITNTVSGDLSFDGLWNLSLDNAIYHISDTIPKLEYVLQCRT
jgi:hypothetical protein